MLIFFIRAITDCPIKQIPFRTVSVCVYKRTHSQLQAGVIHIINCIGASRLQDKYHREIAINRPATISTQREQI